MNLHMLRSMLFLMAAASDGGAGGGGTATEVEVDLPGGVKIKLPKDQADKVIAGRDASKAELRTLNESLGSIQATARASEEKAAAALRDKEAAEAAKTGDMAKVKELHTTELRKERENLGAKLRDKALAALVAATPRIVPKAVGDITSALRGMTRYDFDSDSLIVCDSAGQPIKDDSGKPMSADAFVGKWLGERPYFLLDGTPSGSGADGGGKPPATVGTITRADYDASQRDRVRGPAVSKDLAAGKLRVVD